MKMTKHEYHMSTVSKRDQNYFLHLYQNYLTFTTAALHLETFHICFPEIENSGEWRVRKRNLVLQYILGAGNHVSIHYYYFVRLKE